MTYSERDPRPTSQPGPPRPMPPEAPGAAATVSGIGLGLLGILLLVIGMVVLLCGGLGFVMVPDGLEDGGVVGMLIGGTVMMLLAVLALIGAMLAVRSRR